MVILIYFAEYRIQIILGVFMIWLTEHSMWILLALILFVAVWFIAFFVRNYQAKSDQGSGLHNDIKHAGTVSIKSDVLKYIFSVG